MRPRRAACPTGASVGHQLDLAALAPKGQADGNHIGRALETLALPLEVGRAAAPRAKGDPAHLMVACPQRHDERGLAVPVAGYVAGTGFSIQEKGRTGGVGAF